MQIIKRTADDVVMMTGYTLELDATSARDMGARIVDFDLTTANAALADITGDAPADWAPGAYTYRVGAWALEHPEVLPQPEPVKVPQVVSRAKGKAALVIRGYWQRVVDFVTGLPDGIDKQLAEIALYDTGDWQRDSPFLQQAAQIIGLDDAGLDEIFVFADSINL